jgi:CRP/FNR family transcriptional regulator, cyclic AMP receptor protein
MSFAPFFDYPNASDDRNDDELVLLPELEEHSWSRMFTYATRRRFSKNEIIIREGEVDRSLYIVSSGALQAVLPASRWRFNPRPTVMGPGAVFGEVAFFDGKPRSAGVQAVADGELLVLSLEAFEVFAAKEPALARTVLLDLGRILATRLRRSERPLEA